MAVYKKILQVDGVYPHIIYIHIQNMSNIYYTYILYIDIFVYFFSSLPKSNTLTNRFQVSLPPSSLCHSMAALAALPLPTRDELPVVVAKKLET